MKPVRRRKKPLSLHLFEPSTTRTDARGTLQEVFNTRPWVSILTGRMKTGAVMGQHYHRRTLVAFFLTAGHANVVCVEVRTQRRGQARLRAGQGILFDTGVSHAICFTAPSAFLMLKSRRYTRRDPDTISYKVL